MVKKQREEGERNEASRAEERSEGSSEEALPRSSTGSVRGDLPPESRSAVGGEQGGAVLSGGRLDEQAPQGGNREKP